MKDGPVRRQSGSRSPASRGLTHAQGWATTAGVAGFVLAGVAFCGAFALELRSALSRR